MIWSPSLPCSFHLPISLPAFITWVGALGVGIGVQIGRELCETPGISELPPANLNQSSYSEKKKKNTFIEDFYYKRNLWLLWKLWHFQKRREVTVSELSLWRVWVHFTLIVFSHPEAFLLVFNFCLGLCATSEDTSSPCLWKGEAGLGLC